MNFSIPAPRFLLIASIFFLLILASCLPTLGGRPESASGGNAWAEALRAIDAADASTPSNDITAVYLRQNEEYLQIRIDLLDFQGPRGLSLDLQIGDDSNPQAIPINIHIPSESDSARISLNPLLATVTVDIPLSQIASHPRVDVSTPEDEITGLTLDNPVPASAAPLLLTFYDTFAARFPAEALRSWDGAHTGSRGERHGLRHLLDAAKEYQVPVVLLDLRKPSTLSVLDAMGLLPQIKQMEAEGLLVLPDQAEGEAFFGFSSSPFSWGGKPSSFAFISSSDPNHLHHPLLNKATFIPIATKTDSNHPTPNGPSLEVRRGLLETALNADEKDLLVLGGSLRDTTWGSPDMVGPTLAYFSSRPYIHVLNSEALQIFPTQLGKPDVRPLLVDEDQRKLEALYQNLTQPVLNFAENWKGSPLSSCATDLDKDNQPECVLANGEYLAILDPQGARLTYLFSKGRIGNPPETQDNNSRNLHQLIGPSWQVAVGLSIPSTWDFSAGEAADPGAYPGAFADADDPFKPYEPTINGNQLVFTAQDGSRIKTFQLTASGIEVKYRTQESIETQIPLLVDPGTRFTPGWAQKYVKKNTSGGVAWGLVNGPMVSIQLEGVALSQSKGAITLRAFNESLSLLATPEDPDFEYPPGHYVPFPMAIADLKINSRTSIIQLVFSP